MIGPHYDYLTNSYVKAMGMEPFAHKRPKPVAAYYVCEDGVFTHPYNAFDICVVYNHMLYAREFDGLAWSRLDSNPSIL